MADILLELTNFTTKLSSAAGSMTGIFAALVGLALIGLLFSRIGK